MGNMGEWNKKKIEGKIEKLEKIQRKIREKLEKYRKKIEKISDTTEKKSNKKIEKKSKEKGKSSEDNRENKKGKKFKSEDKKREFRGEHRQEKGIEKKKKKEKKKGKKVKICPACSAFSKRELEDAKNIEGMDVQIGCMGYCKKKYPKLEKKYHGLVEKKHICTDAHEDFWRKAQTEYRPEKKIRKNIIRQEKAGQENQRPEVQNGESDDKGSKS